MMESISITRIDVLNSKIPNFKLSYLKVTKDSVPHFNSYLDQKTRVSSLKLRDLSLNLNALGSDPQPLKQSFGVTGSLCLDLSCTRHFLEHTLLDFFVDSTRRIFKKYLVLNPISKKRRLRLLAFARDCIYDIRLFSRYGVENIIP